VTRPMMALVVLALFSTPKATNARQEGAKRTFSVADRAQITLTANWSQRFDIDPPPVPLLLSSSPQFGFTDFVALENRGRPAILEIGASGNPFIGKNSVQLDTLIHESLLSSLFYLFFPRREAVSLSPSLPLTWSSVSRTTKRGRETSRTP
jgi:hypothetical protein